MGINLRASRGWLRLGAVIVLFGAGVSQILGLLRAPLASSEVFPFVLHEDPLPVPVVLVVLDELPVASLMTDRGEIDAELFPNFARLTVDATWFRNTTTTGVFTHDAMPSILTGRYPDPDRGMTDLHPRNLFTLLGRNYPIHMIERLPGFCPVARCTSAIGPPGSSLGPGFASFDYSERGADLTNVLDMIEEVNREQPAKPAFYFAHVVLPHSPWRYLPSGQRYEEREPEPGEIDIPGPGKAWSDDRWLTTQVHQRHLLQLALVDRLIGVLRRTMERAGIYDDALLVVTADHGIAFEPGLPKRVITEPRTLGSIGHVPLFVKTPGQKSGGISDRPMSVVDIFPTIADVLGLEKVWPDVDGRSAFASIPASRVRLLEGFEIDPSGSDVYASIATKSHRFGSELGSLDLFGAAPGTSERLLGLGSNDLEPLTHPSAVATIRDAPLIETADPRGPVFPALVEGTVEARGRYKVAIVVNGVVVAVTRTYRAAGQWRFYAMVSPDVFGEPPNDISAVVLREAVFSSGAMLRPPANP